MTTNKNTDLNKNPVVVIIGVIGTIMAICGVCVTLTIFVTGRENLPEILNSSSVVVQNIPTDIDTSNSILASVPGATQRCEEFQGSPVARNSITTHQIDIWRQIGKTDKSETARIIYCEIHQIPGFRGFVEGDEIPAGVVITADFGFDWKNMYSGALERLVHDGGGWGVFLSYEPFVVQHADDLANDVGGQYWFVSQ